MKRILISMLMAVMALTGCHKEYITEEVYNYDGSQVFTREYTVQPKDWEVGDYPDGRPYLYASFENPDITPKVMDYGAVMAYVWNTYDQKTGAGSWNPLPFVYPYLYQGEDGETYAVGENIRFEFEDNTVTFVIEDLDSYTPEETINPIIFKVVCISNMK